MNESFIPEGTWAPPYPKTILVGRGQSATEIPITPEDIDVRALDYMPLDYKALFGSDFFLMASDEEFRAGVTLWGKAWHQVPAASLPTSEAALAVMAGCGRDVRRWRKISKMALRGFRLATDGRLYHPVIAKFALDGFRQLRANSRNAKRRWEKDQVPENTQNDPMPSHDAPHSQNAGRGISARNAIEGRGGEGIKKDIYPPDSDTASPPPILAEFEAWFGAFPRHAGKGAARKAYAEARAKGISAETLITAAIAYAKTREGEDPKFTKHPAKWLEDECWTDQKNEAPEPAHRPGTTSDTLWRLRIKHYKKFWHPDWGPKPTEKNNHVPNHILIEFGYKPSEDFAETDALKAPSHT